MASRFTSTGNEHDSASRASEGQLATARVCRYFSRTGSCRAGKECPFLHDDTRILCAQVANVKPTNEDMVEDSGSAGGLGLAEDDGMIQDRRQAVTSSVDASRVVSRPVPKAQTQNPREFQLGQIRRRYSPKETRQSSGQPGGASTLLKFSLTPSDPDFPFEITSLDCLLSVPSEYPKAKPTLRVGNKDIPRGFAINIETGFDQLVKEHPDVSLLELVKLLDKHLESFLSAPKVETVKLVLNKDTRHLSALPTRSVEPVVSLPTSENVSTLVKQPAEEILQRPAEVFTEEQKAEASKRREVETKQLEARMGRLPLYKKSGDGIAYTLPIEPRRRTELPMALQAIRVVQLFVPLLYPLQPCRIGFERVDQAYSTSVEYGFEQKSIQQKETTLMGHVNYLAQNIHVLAKTLVPKNPKMITQPLTVQDTSSAKGKTVERQQDPERSHVQYISRPPEWAIIDHEHSNTDTDDLYSYDSDETEDEDGGAEVNEGRKESSQAPVQNIERGTAISFPFIELYGIELLEIVILNISVKCERCKDSTEIKGLKDGTTKSEICRKCASPLSIGFRRDLVHAHAVRAGFLDLEGCIVGDMLPSTFIPTCSRCSTLYPAPGLISLQGETTSNVCRECHQKFTFKIPQVKFLRISAIDRLHPSSVPRRKKETLGLSPGSELPKRGRCRHYSKSYRWFRFSCCQKVYACDKCHDEGEEHPNEWANRMICGWCSREQNYRPEDCGICHSTMVGKRRGGGFWEGGKGTRDKVKMSRKDKRKFRRPGAAVKKT